jgi:hypothetical protein
LLAIAAFTVVIYFGQAHKKRIERDGFMSVRRVGILLVFVAGTLLAFKIVPQRQQLPANLEQALNEQALANLDAAHNIVVTGNRPADGLVPRLNAWSRTYLTSDEYINNALKMREKGLEIGVRYTSVEVTLTPSGIERDGNRVILHAKDRFTEHRVYDVLLSSTLPTESGGVTNHDFVFSTAHPSGSKKAGPYSVEVDGIVYTLILDVNEPQMLHSRDASTYCCDPDEQWYASQPVGRPLEDKPGIPYQAK